jgi:hypothetical protein
MFDVSITNILLSADVGVIFAKKPVAVSALLFDVVATLVL